MAGVLLLGFRMPAAIAMPISLVVAAAVAFFAWQIDLVTIGASIVQGILGVVVANIDVLVGAAVLDPAARAIVVALCMAVLSPVMAELGKHLDEADIDVPKGGDVDAA